MFSCARAERKRQLPLGSPFLALDVTDHLVKVADDVTLEWTLEGRPAGRVDVGLAAGEDDGAVRLAVAVLCADIVEDIAGSIFSGPACSEGRSACGNEGGQSQERARGQLQLEGGKARTVVDDDRVPLMVRPVGRFGTRFDDGALLRDREHPLRHLDGGRARRSRAGSTSQRSASQRASRTSRREKSEQAEVQGRESLLQRGDLERGRKGRHGNLKRTPPHVDAAPTSDVGLSCKTMSAVTRLQQSSVNRSSTSLITPTITALSEHHTNQVDQHLLDFLTAEVLLLVSSCTPSCSRTHPIAFGDQVTRLLIDSEQVARARRAAHEKLVEADFLSLADKAAALSLDDTPSAPTPTVSAEKRLALRNQADEAVKRRLDTMGFKVGWAMAERYTPFPSRWSKSRS